MKLGTISRALIWQFVSLKGPDPFNYCVILFHAGAFTLFWTVGLLIMAAEYFNIFGLKTYKKLQKNCNTLSDTRKIFKVYFHILS